MKLANELLNLRRVLVVGILSLTLAASFLSTDGMLLAVVAWLCFLLLLTTYLFDIAYHNTKNLELTNKTLILLRLFYKGIRVQKRLDVVDVKGYYTGEQYDWVTDTKFPEKVLHDRRRNTMAERARVYITLSDVLDLGCGTGLITQILPGNVTGVDISPWKVERARLHCPHATLVVGDVEDLKSLFADNSFDAVVCTDVLEHLEKPNWAVSEAWRVLKPGGTFIGTVPSRHVIWRLRRFLTTADASGEPFHIHYSKGKLRQLLRSFDVSEISSQCLGLELFFAVTKKEDNNVKE